MDFTYLREFEQPIPIDGDARRRLGTRLVNAKGLKTWHPDNDTKKYDYDTPDIGKIWIYIDKNLGPAIQFSPEGWYRLYNQDIGNILSDIDDSIQDLDYVIKVENKPDESKSINLTLDGSEKDQLYLNTECVRTNSEECIKILQTVWNRMVSRYNSERISLDDQLKPPIYQD